MKTLQNVTPTPEQLQLLTLPRPGIRVVRGAAGSGKTTTAILMMKLSIGYFIDHFLATNNTGMINLRVFTFNKTLAAYVNDLVAEVACNTPGVKEKLNIEVTTLSKYMYQRLANNKSTTILSQSRQAAKIQQLGHKIPLAPQFLSDEVEYLLGRLRIDKLEEYLEMERTGRGAKPRVDKQLRRRILDEVVYPYIHFKKSTRHADWNDLALAFSSQKVDDIHIAIVDEAQDFSANQLRAITKQLAETNFTTIVLDSNQKIYKRGFTWKEVGITGASYTRLEINYRNTLQIARFASKLLENAEIPVDEDGTLPKLTGISQNGAKPLVVKGRFNKQIEFILHYIKENINLNEQSVGFLHAKGGGWFDGLRSTLKRNKIEFVEISGEREWPKCNANVALSTIHSAKGLEFDYVFIVGIENRHFRFESSDYQDGDYSSAIKLLSMAITRAKENVILSYKEDTKPSFLVHLDPSTYDLVAL